MGCYYYFNDVIENIVMVSGSGKEWKGEEKKSGTLKVSKLQGVVSFCWTSPIVIG